MKTAIFGGTFDPVHNEHINICLSAKKQFALGNIIVMPSGKPPHKREEKLFASPADRLQMANIAFNGRQGVAVSGYETNKDKPSYTYDTVKHIKGDSGGEIYLIIGADSLIDFKTWYNYKKILSLCTLIVCGRKGYKGLREHTRQIEEESGKKVLVCGYNGADISSTMLKVFLEFGIDCKEYIDGNVLEYIRQNNLYNNYSFYINKLKRMLSPKRYIHTVYTVISALKLARRTGCDTKKTFLAAALHDCTKKLSDQELKNYGFVLNSNVPEPVAHSVSGSYIARTVFKINDKDILNSIRYHTTGRKDMSLLEKVIYVADCIEDTRDYEGVDILRKAVEEDFEKGFLKCMEVTIQQLKTSERKIRVSNMTMEAYKYYINKNSGEEYES